MSNVGNFVSRVMAIKDPQAMRAFFEAEAAEGEPNIARIPNFEPRQR